MAESRNLVGLMAAGIADNAEDAPDLVREVLYSQGRIL
jgi:hypothetical protein